VAITWRYSEGSHGVVASITGAMWGGRSTSTRELWRGWGPSGRDGVGGRGGRVRRVAQAAVAQQQGPDGGLEVSREVSVVGELQAGTAQGQQRQ
jgi:hypothetical protein